MGDLSFDFGEGEAELSPDGTYRYRLTRRWGAIGPRVTWVMLNPSTADALADDLTIRKCIGFSRRLGAVALDVVNVYALRSTDPALLAEHPDPVGPENDRAIVDGLLLGTGLVIVAWGAHPMAEARVPALRELLHRTGRIPFCLGTTKEGAPRHPSRLSYDTPLEPWVPPTSGIRTEGT